MQGFNRYYPPTYDPKVHATLNAVHGKHALGDRARKIGQGILIARFELPFNIWCGGCDAHIGQGVRYNAEKRKVGDYYTTPIYAFRCKCHQCDHWFEIQTDPKNTRYVITEGARLRHEEWDAAEAGAFVLDQKDKDAPVDPLAQLEKGAIDKANALSAAERLEAMQDLNDERWSDPYTLSKSLRNVFRADKKERKIRDDSDSALKTRLSLPASLILEDETTESKDAAHEEWQKERANLRLDAEAYRQQQRSAIVGSSLVIAPKKKSSISTSLTSASTAKGKPSNSSAKSALTAQLLRNTQKLGFEARLNLKRK